MSGEKTEIKVHNISNLSVLSFMEFIELQGDFKIDDPDANLLLQKRIIEKGFKYPVFCWEGKDKKKYTIDAHQRLKALKTLTTGGLTIENKLFIKLIRFRTGWYMLTILMKPKKKYCI